MPDLPCHKEDSFYMFITLNTDIWLPKVRGDLEESIKKRMGAKPSPDKQAYDELISDRYEQLMRTGRPNKYLPPYEYDNLELAMCHTPRFNRFLAEVKQLTLELDGKFWCEASTGYSYEDGISLL